MKVCVFLTVVWLAFSLMKRTTSTSLPSEVSPLLPPPPEESTNSQPLLQGRATNSAPTSPRATPGSAPTTPRATLGSAPTGATPGSASTTPRAAPGLASTTPRAAPGSASSTPRAAPGSASTTPGATPGSAPTTPRAPSGSARTTPGATPGSAPTTPRATLGSAPTGATPGSASTTPRAAPGSASTTPRAAPGSTSTTPGATPGSAPTTPRAPSGSAPTTPRATPGSAPTTPRATPGSAPTTPRATPGSAPTTPRATPGSAPTTPRATPGSAPTTPRATPGSAPTTPRATPGSAPTTPRAPSGSAPTTPRATPGSAPTTPRATPGSAPTTPRATPNTSSLLPEGVSSSSPLPSEETSGSPSLEITGSGDTAATTTASPSEKVTCDSQPCKYGATCVNLYHGVDCQCPYGYYYSPKSCQLGKVFPGQISMKQQYDPAMEDVQSQQYSEVYDTITNFFNATFKDKHYKETRLTNIEPSPATLRKLSKTGGNIIVTLFNVFEESTDLTSTDVMKLIQTSTCDGVIICTSFKNIPQCDVYCDSDTTECKETNDGSFPTCVCKKGLAKKKPEDKACLLCDAAECSPEKNKHCFMDAKQVPVCRCLVGYQNQSGNCQKCSFGYSGENCEDSYLAVLVGVGVTCGFVIVVLTGVLIYRCLRENREPSLESKSLLGNDYATIRKASKGSSAANSVVNDRIFPRVQIKNPEPIKKTTTADQGYQKRTSHEAGVLNRSYLPERDYDDDNNPWLEMSSRDRL